MKRITQADMDYVRQFYGEIPLAEISEHLQLCVSTVRKIARNMQLVISKEQMKRLRARAHTKKLNPNPVTETTYMLICRYDFEKMGINHICRLLGRSPETVQAILTECKANGNYQRYNRYGKSD